MFGWNKDLLEEKYNALIIGTDDALLYKEMISICNGFNIDTINIFKENASDIIKILRLSNKEKFILLNELLTIDKDDDVSLNDYISNYLKFYNNLPSDIKNMFYYIEKKLNYENSKDLKLKKEVIKDDDLYNFVYYLFLMINSEYKEKLDYLFDNRLINISDKKIANRYNMDNITFILEKENNPYINIVNTRNKSMYDCLNHEICHAVKFLYDYKVYNLLPYTDEVCSIYISFLTCILNSNDNDFFKCYFNYYKSLKDNIVVNYIVKNMSMSLYPDKKNVYFEQINKFLTVDINDLLSEDCTMAFKYGFSLVIALYLLEVYEKDEEKCFCFFDKLLKYCGNSYKDYLNMIEFPYNKFYYGTDLLYKYDDYFSKELKKRRII